MRWVLLGTTLLGGLAFASPASAADVFFSGPPGNSTNGLMLSTAVGPPGCAPAPYCSVVDGGLGADGRVVGGGPYDDCPFQYHYHGTLFGQPDPNINGCGWGVLIPEPLPPGALLMSEAITFETRAIRTERPGTAENYVGDSVEKLKAAEPFTGETPQLDAAIALDKKAKKLLDKIQDEDEKNKGKKERKAKDLLEEALTMKVPLFDSLVAQ